MTNPSTSGLAIVFDLGGVLFDWNPAHLYLKYFDGDQRAVERFLEEIQFTAWNLRQDQGRPFSIAVAEHCAKFPQYRDLIRAYDIEWEESVRGPIPGSVEILRALWKAGESLYALSNWSEEKFNLIKTRFEFLKYFQAILVSGSVGWAKPDPRIFEAFLTKIGRQAQDCLLIDDSTANIQAAQSLGFRTIHFRSPDQLKRELRRMGIGRFPETDSTVD